MNRVAKVWMYNNYVGELVETDAGYAYTYDGNYLQLPDAKPLAFSLPLQSKVFVIMYYLLFFDGLIPEGWLLAIVEKNWKLNERDRMGILMVCCQYCIGAISVTVL